MSSEGTPGYPAPDTACIVETVTRAASSCLPPASAITSGTVAQLGFVTMAPFNLWIAAAAG